MTNYRRRPRRSKLASVPTREIVGELKSRQRVARRRKQASEDMMKKVMGEIADLANETGSWGYGNFSDDVENVLINYMGSPYRAKKFQEALGIPLDDGWKYDAEGMTDWRQISVREHFLDKPWEDIFDEEYGSRR